MKARHAVLAPCALLAAVACGSVDPIRSCDAVGGATPLCGFQNPEDLALLADGRHVLVSEYGDGGQRPGRISLLDLASGDHATLFAGGEPTAPGPWGAADCEGPPSSAFSPHGIDLSQRTKDNIPTLYYQRHDYSSDASQSSVTMNGNTVKTGGSIVPGMKVEEILPDSVVLNYQGTQFRLRALNSWVNL